jgi:hypothetical protein
LLGETGALIAEWMGMGIPITTSEALSRCTSVVCPSSLLEPVAGRCVRLCAMVCPSPDTDLPLASGPVAILYLQPSWSHLTALVKIDVR